MYPPGWDGDYGEGHQGWRNHVLNVQGAFESGQVGVSIVDLSAMLTTDGQVPDRMVIDKIQYNVHDCKVQLFWNRNPQSEIAYLEGEGCLNFPGGLIDPAPAGNESGDLYITTLDPPGTAVTFNGFFNVTVHFRLKKD